MIIVGYQGIGKSTLAKSGNGFIDLESGNFWVEGHRSPDWSIVYANIAKHLNEQGYHVFTSSHKVVRKALLEIMKEEKVAICYPALFLKKEWVNKLETRYHLSNLEKDYKAWRNAAEMYDENITDLMMETNMIHIILKDMKYNLSDEINKVIMKYGGK